jgi:hypothetical protein
VVLGASVIEVRAPSVTVVVKLDKSLNENRLELPCKSKEVGSPLVDGKSFWGKILKPRFTASTLPTIVVCVVTIENSLELNMISTSVPGVE